jgi:hypothetical protein
MEHFKKSQGQFHKSENVDSEPQAEESGIFENLKNMFS